MRCVERRRPRGSARASAATARRCQPRSGMPDAPSRSSRTRLAPPPAPARHRDRRAARLRAHERCGHRALRTRLGVRPARRSSRRRRQSQAFRPATRRGIEATRSGKAKFMRFSWSGRARDRSGRQHSLGEQSLSTGNHRKVKPASTHVPLPTLEILRASLVNHHVVARRYPRPSPVDSRRDDRCRTACRATTDSVSLHPQRRRLPVQPFHSVACGAARPCTTG